MSREKETGRLEGFSDGVFAFAITLLAIDLKFVPEIMTSNKALWVRIMSAWPSFLTFIISFYTLLTLWVHHHRIFKLIYRANRNVLFANGFLLSLVVTVPVTTSLLADYIVSPAANAAMEIYSANFLLINFSYNTLMYTVSRDRSLLKQNVTQDAIIRLRRQFLFGLPGYTAAFIVSFFHEWFSLAILILFRIYWAITARPEEG